MPLPPKYGESSWNSCKKKRLLLRRRRCNCLQEMKQGIVCDVRREPRPLSWGCCGCHVPMSTRETIRRIGATLSRGWVLGSVTAPRSRASFTLRFSQFLSKFELYRRVRESRSTRDASHNLAPNSREGHLSPAQLACLLSHAQYFVAPRGKMAPKGGARTATRRKPCRLVVCRFSGRSSVW